MHKQDDRTHPLCAEGGTLVGRKDGRRERESDEQWGRVHVLWYTVNGNIAPRVDGKYGLAIVVILSAAKDLLVRCTKQVLRCAQDDKLCYPGTSLCRAERRGATSRSRPPR